MGKVSKMTSSKSICLFGVEQELLRSLFLLESFSREAQMEKAYIKNNSKHRPPEVSTTKIFK